MNPAPNRRWFRFSLIWLFVWTAALAVPLALAALGMREVRWWNEREQFAQEHYTKIQSVGLTGPYYRPFGTAPTIEIILDFGAAQAELDRARYLFPETSYVGQFTTKQAEDDARQAKSFDDSEVTWFGEHPPWYPSDGQRP